MIKLYGTPLSRAARCLWMLREVGVPFENVPTHFAGEAQSAEFRKINPNGRVPALDDDGLVLFESLAINLHLAEKYGKDLGPRDQTERAQQVQWSIWAVTELEPGVIDAFLHRVMLPEAQRNAKLADAGEAKLARPLAVLDAELGRRDWLVGGRFTVADLNVASVLMVAPIARIDLTSFPRLQRWLGACTTRPAARG
ncbi:MAG: glutathione S-transferase family protein [Proteobacteria bacterium]|nr:MAG: glutathione S-transferase family protein [Pseudomonadota bacterium]